jgi:hypothetical protein
MNNARYKPVKDFSGFNKDMKTGAVIYTNTDQYEAFVNKKKKEKDMTSRLAQVEASLDRIISKLDSLEHLKND